MSTYLIRLIFGKTKDRKYILQLCKYLHLRRSVVKLSYFEFTRTCGEVVVSECHVIPSPISLIGCPVKCVGTANLVVKLSVTRLPL